MEKLEALIELLDKPDDEIWGQYYMDDAEKIYTENHENLLPKLLGQWKMWPNNRQMHLACILGFAGTQSELKLIKELLSSSNKHVARYAQDALEEHRSST
ncbi:hypothetical protein [Sessilibacter corallicola]|uniref:HEAT repeat domain-containing protein n=1 Tax=Sessilibacter corallicola TaxID=2904075 RepID=A0ABQ0AF87_9GAMM